MRWERTAAELREENARLREESAGLREEPARRDALAEEIAAGLGA